MRVAIPAKTDGNIFEHFGRTQMFQIYDIENNKIIRSGLFDSSEYEHEELAKVLSALTVNKVMAAHVGNHMVETLNSFGIDIYTNVTGSCTDIINKFLSGELDKDENILLNESTHECCHHEGN
ncbi:MAG: hypothetical protein K6G38_04325 [Gammaproteobacteria bacterium]|nr:hypothetical protein [Gammaproteobacteria bacterium]